MKKIKILFEFMMIILSINQLQNQSMVLVVRNLKNNKEHNIDNIIDKKQLNETCKF